MSYTVTQLPLPAGQPGQPRKASNFFEVLAEAWGKTLDEQANRIQAQSDVVSGGDNTPGQITKLTALAAELGFVSNSANTSISSVAQGLETMARKQ